MHASRCGGHVGPRDLRLLLVSWLFRAVRGGRVSLAILAGALWSGVAMAQPLIIATEPQVTAAPLIIAQQRGWFAEEGLDIHFVHFHANRTMLTALAEGDVDVAMVDMGADVFTMAADHQLRIIAGVEQLNGDYPRYAWLMSGALAGSDLGGLGDKAGAVLGLTEQGSLARYLLSRRFPDLVAEIAYSSEGSDVALAAALSQGDVDAALLPAHLAADLEATGAGSVSAWAGQLEGPVALSVLMTTVAQARLRPDVMERFLRAYVRGVRAYHDAILRTPSVDTGDGVVSETDNGAESITEARRAALFAIVAEGARRPLEEVVAAPPYISADGRVDQPSISAQLAWWQHQGDCRADISLRAVLDLGPLDAAVQSLEMTADEERDAAERLANQTSGDDDPGTARQTDPTAAGGP